MPYRLRAEETITEGIRRLLIERVDRIILELTNPPLGRDKGVHNARKSCKRVRAALRLVRDEIGEDLYKFENTRLESMVFGVGHDRASRYAWIQLVRQKHLYHHVQQHNKHHHGSIG